MLLVWPVTDEEEEETSLDSRLLKHFEFSGRTTASSSFRKKRRRRRRTAALEKKKTQKGVM